MTPGAPRPWVPTYVALVFAWGLTFYFIALSLETFTPVGVAFCRCLLAAATLLVVCLFTRTRLPPRSMWSRLAVFSFLVATGPWILIGVAVTHATSSLAAIAGSTTAIWVLVINVLFFPEGRPSRSRVAGIFIGFAGILIVLGVWNGVGGATAVGILAQLVGVFIWAFSLPYSHRYLTGDAAASSLSPVSLTAATFILATATLLPITLIFGATQGPIRLSSALGTLAVGVISSGLATVWLLRLVKRTDTTTASSATYLMPVVALVAGVVLLGEPVSWYEPVGACVILLGAAMAQGALPRPR